MLKSRADLSYLVTKICEENAINLIPMRHERLHIYNKMCTDLRSEIHSAKSKMRKDLAAARSALTEKQDPSQSLTQQQEAIKKMEEEHKLKFQKVEQFNLLFASFSKINFFF